MFLLVDYSVMIIVIEMYVFFFFFFVNSLKKFNVSIHTYSFQVKERVDLIIFLFFYKISQK